jgi:lipoate-protein ligase B
MLPGSVVLGSVPYRQALALQGRIAEEVVRGDHPGMLLLLEHPATITLGRRAGSADLLAGEDRLARLGIEVVRVGRGGRATVHAPGQLVGYPIVRLSARGRGVRRFVGALETMLVDVCRRFGVEARAGDRAPGVFVGDRKIASIGLEIRRGVVRHGFALNVDMDLSSFGWIVPCGSPGLEATDLSHAAGGRITVRDAIAAVRDAWGGCFAAPPSSASLCEGPR